jgi:hypothetical protein
MHPLLEDREVGAQLAGSEGWRDDHFATAYRSSAPEKSAGDRHALSWRSALAAPERLSARRPPLAGCGTSVCATTRLRLAREGRAPNGAGRIPVGEPQPPELVVCHELLDQRKELSLLKPDVFVKQLSRRIQRLSIDDAGRHGNVEFASEPLELHVLDACLAQGSRLRRDVPEEKRKELFFLIPKVDTLFVPEELHEFPGRHKPSRSISVRGSTAQPQCLHESIVMVARERDQGGVALHSTTLACSVVRAALGELTRPRHDCVLAHHRLIRADREVAKARLAFAVHSRSIWQVARARV